MKNVLKFSGALSLALAIAIVPAAAQDTADGVYAVEQAERGLAVYDENCSACHAGDLAGTPGGPGLMGSRFKALWSKKSVGELYTKIHDTMPAGMGGTLTEEQYLDVVAYILQFNKFAAGDAPMTADIEALNAVTIGTAAAQ